MEEGGVMGGRYPQRERKTTQSPETKRMNLELAEILQKERPVAKPQEESAPVTTVDAIFWMAGLCQHPILPSEST